MRQGALVFNHLKEKYDIRFDLEEFFGELQDGQELEVYINNNWISTTLKLVDGQWNLVGISSCIEELDGLAVRI